jgi:hypothetical protein
LTSSILHVYHIDISFQKQQPSPARREESGVAAMDSFTGKLAAITGGGNEAAVAEYTSAAQAVAAQAVAAQAT